MRILSLFLSFLMISFAFSDQENFKNRKIDAVKAVHTPKIDGKLDDSCWKEAPSASPFIDSYTSKPAQDQTISFVLYDEKALYVAFKCFDSHPDQIIATETKRDGNLLNDDFVEVSVDPYDLGRFSSRDVFRVNAIGTQFTERGGGGAEKAEWKGNWQAATQRTKFGWTAEMAIPWDILDLPSSSKPVTIGINFARHQARTDVFSFWSNLGFPFHHEWNGHLVGIILPKTEKKKLRILSYAFAGTEPKHSKMLRSGLNLRFKPKSSLTSLFTINPDFSNVEQEVESIDFSYFPRAYSDKRPFFQEGEGFFGVGQELFYSRNIKMIDAGLKFYGKMKRTNFGIMDCADFDKWNAFVLSMRQDIGETSKASLSFVRKDEAFDFNQIFSLSASTRWKDLSPSVNLSGSKTSPGGEGSIGSIRLSWSRPSIFVSGSYSYLSPGYSPSLGFVPYEARKGWDFNFAYQNQRFMGNNFMNSGIYAYDYNRYKGGDYISYLSSWLAFRFRKGANRSYGTLFSFDSTKFGGVSDWVVGLKPDISYRFEGYSFSLSTNVSAGFRQGERYVFIKPGVSFGLDKNRFKVKYYSELLWHKEKERQHVIWLNFNITPEHSIGSRLVYRKGKWNGYLSYRQTVRKGIDAYLILGAPNAEEFQKRALVKLLVPIW